MATLSIAGATTATLTIGGIAIAGIPLIGILVFLMGGPVIALLGGISAAMGVSCMGALVNIVQNLSLGSVILLSTICGGA